MANVNRPRDVPCEMNPYRVHLVKVKMPDLRCFFLAMLQLEKTALTVPDCIDRCSAAVDQITWASTCAFKKIIHSFKLEDQWRKLIDSFQLYKFLNANKSIILSQFTRVAMLCEQCKQKRDWLTKKKLTITVGLVLLHKSHLFHQQYGINTRAFRARAWMRFWNRHYGSKCYDVCRTISVHIGKHGV